MYTVLVLIKFMNVAVPVRLRCGCGKLTFLLSFIIFAIFKNVVHSLEPGETLCCGCDAVAFIFSIYLKPVL